MTDPWDTTPRMLSELCEGHGSFMLEIYALDLDNGVRMWVCKSCWMRMWIKFGKPKQTHPDTRGAA